MTEAYPLHWPEGWPRTHWNDRQYTLAGGHASQSWDRVVRRLLTELERLGATHVVLSTNQPLRVSDGLPYSAKRIIDDPGAAIYFELDGRALVMAQDRYERLVDNIRSLALAIEGLRQMERHGGAHMMERAFAGFAALPPPIAGARPWYDVLGIPPEPDAMRIKIAYKLMAKKHHPDRGGDPDKMAEINAAYQQALEACG